MHGATTDHGVLEAARAVRPYLEDLVGRRSAVDLDGRIAAILHQAERGEDVTEPLRELLGGSEGTAAFLAEVLADAPDFRPPDVQPAFAGGPLRGFDPLPGDPDPVIHAGKYVCPQGDFVWYRPSVGTPIADCPSHGPVLIKT